MIGKLINIEGIDGSGKGTQAIRLTRELQKKGIKTKLYSFPCYDETFFGKEIGAFLRGEFGSIDEVHPKLASVLYASDRLEKKSDIINDLEKGYYVICDRYVESNMAHQASKMPEIEREKFVDWLSELEYIVNGMPKPDITIFLDVPLSVSKELVLKKKARSYTEEKEDIHEAAHGYLEKVYSTYKYLRERMEWDYIKCTEKSELKSIEYVGEEILNLVLSRSIK